MSHGGPGTYESGSGLSLTDFLGILRRRRLIILLTVFVITGLASYLAFHLTPRYTATADVMIKRPQFRVIDFEGGVDDSRDRGLVETELDVLRSDFHAQRVIDDLDLLSDAEFNPLLRPEYGAPSLLASLTEWIPPHWLDLAQTKDDEPSLLATLMEWIPPHWLSTVDAAAQQLYALPSAPQPEPVDTVEHPQSYDDDRQMAATVHQLHGALQVSQHGDSYVVSIDLTSTDPEKAARIANTVAETYVAGQRDEKLAVTREAVDWLTDRVEQLRSSVLKSENAIEDYRTTNRMVVGTRGSLGEQELANLNLELLKQHAEVVESEARLRQVREVQQRGGSYGSLSEVMRSPVIIDLRDQEIQLLREEGQLSKEYGPQHPKMLELKAEKQELATKIDLEIGNILSSLENEVEVARRREETLAKSLEDAKDRSAVTSQAEVPLRQLEREAQANRSLYETFLKRMKETEEKLNLVKADAQIVSPATVPDVPSFPKPRLMIPIGFVSSVMLGVLIAFLREGLDRAFRTGRELHEVLGVASFGLVPSIRQSKRRLKPHRYLLEKPLSGYADAIRAVQKSAELCCTEGQSHVVFVTSALPGEGKTTLALSLAASAARSGRKTIIVDLDLRRPSIAREMEQPCGPGLIEFLTSKLPVDKIIHAAAFQDNFHFIPVKALTSSPVDLLESQKMAALMVELRDRYECIFLDGPPALVTEARVGALLADTVLYAVQWEKTQAEVASYGLEALGGARVSVTGLVLTQVDLKRQAKYGYGDAAIYYREYRRYYAE